MVSILLWLRLRSQGVWQLAVLRIPHTNPPLASWAFSVGVFSETGSLVGQGIRPGLHQQTVVIHVMVLIDNVSQGFYHCSCPHPLIWQLTIMPRRCSCPLPPAWVRGEELRMCGDGFGLQAFEVQFEDACSML